MKQKVYLTLLFPLLILSCNLEEPGTGTSSAVLEYTDTHLTPNAPTKGNGLNVNFVNVLDESHDLEEIMCEEERILYFPVNRDDALSVVNWEVELLAMQLSIMYSVDRLLVATGQTSTHRIPRLSEQRRLALAEDALNAAQDFNSPREYALNALIIAGYETAFRATALGDCRIYGEHDDSRPCEGEELDNDQYYRSCGMTQVRANDRNPGNYARRPYSCYELFNPENALRATMLLLEEIYEEYGFWNLSRYNGAGSSADRYEARHLLMLNEVISRTNSSIPVQSRYVESYEVFNDDE